MEKRKTNWPHCNWPESYGWKAGN